MDVFVPLHYIINAHIVNHYENVIPNMVLFLIFGLYSERENPGNAIGLSIASILFGQPMFIVLVCWIILCLLRNIRI